MKGSNTKKQKKEKKKRKKRKNSERSLSVVFLQALLLLLALFVVAHAGPTPEMVRQRLADLHRQNMTLRHGRVVHRVSRRHKILLRQISSHSARQQNPTNIEPLFLQAVTSPVADATGACSDVQFCTVR